MGVVAELVLIRHGQSESNVAFPKADAAGLLESGLTGRDADVKLTDLGRAQAAAVGRWLAGLPEGRRPEVAITSPYVRARETWRIAAEASGIAFAAPGTDDRLVDRLLGDLEMMTLAAIRKHFPEEEQRHAEAGDYHYRPPNGEAFGDIKVRLASFLTDLNRDHAGRRVVVVAHDSVVLMMRAVIEELDWDAVARVADGNHVRNASVSRFDGASGRLVLDVYNSVGHLPAAAQPRDVPSDAPDQAAPPDAAA